MLERRREPRLSWNCTAPLSETIQRPPRLRIGGYGSVLLQEWRDPGPKGLWARSPGGLGPGPPGLGARPTRGLGLFPTTSQLRFFRKPGGSLGCRLKRLLRRWGPGGKRSRDTPPNPPPPPPPRFGAVREKGRGFSPSPPSATIQHAPQGRRIGIMENKMETVGNIGHTEGNSIASCGPTLSPKPQTLNPKPYTRNPKP